MSAAPPSRSFNLGAKARKYGAALKSGALTRLAYRSELIGSGLSFALFVFLFINVWAAVFAGKDELSGYTREACVWYFIVAELVIFGMQGAFTELADEVKSGSVAYGLGRPYSFPLYQMAQHFGSALAGSAALAPSGIAMGLLATGACPMSGPAHAALALASFAMGLALHFALILSVALSAFWVEENSAFFWIYSKVLLVTGTFMPLEFLPEWAQGALRWTPLPYVTWAPARAFARLDEETLAIMAAQAAWLAGGMAMAFFLFNKGVRRVSIQGG
jgi:ABC-2 type transport system permease protein